MTVTTLYRFYDPAGALLYVGIAGNPGRRFQQHAKDKGWWADVARSTMEHFASREEAAAAEVAAIITEKPLYNVVHNRGATSWTCTDDYRCDSDCAGAGRYRFTTSRGLCWHTETLTLKPEIDLTPCVDEIYGDWEDEALRGQEEVRHWMRRVIDRNGGHPPYSVSIYWSVQTDHTSQTAPFGHLWGNRHADLGDFLTHFSHPFDITSGTYVNFLTLPIEHRFPEFTAALGWQPSALAPTCPFFHLYDHAIAYQRGWSGQDARAGSGS